MSDFRATQSGRLLEDGKYPRVGIVGEPGMQLEVANLMDGLSLGRHVIITILGGENIAAAGFFPAMAREAARYLEEAADKVEQRHGTDAGVWTP